MGKLYGICESYLNKAGIIKKNYEMKLLHNINN